MSREKLLGEARAALSQLPDLVAELARLVADRNHDVSGWQKKVVGSPAPLSIPIVHLTDQRHKPGWEGEDPRIQDLGDRYGITPSLETWVRVLQDEFPGTHQLTEKEAWVRKRWGELPAVIELTEQATVRSECAVLIEYWSFIEDQRWAVELAEDVQRITRVVKAQLGIRPEYRPTCRKCGSTVIPVDADRNLTSWESAAYGACTGCDWTYPTGPALAALGQVQAPMQLRDIAPVIGIPVKTLHRWYEEGLISPATDGQKRNKLFDLAAVREVVTRVRAG